MSHEYWGLNEPPFATSSDRYFHRTPNVEEAFARLHFLVEHRRRLGLLLGTPGAGKTQLLRVFARQAKQAGRQVAMTSALAIEPAELLGELARDFGVNLPASATAATAWRALDEFFAASRYQRLDSVLLVDDADDAEPAAIAQLARLAQYPFSTGGQLTLVLAGRESHVTALGPRIMDLAELRIDVEPWDAADTVNFMRQAMAAAGARREIFSPAAIARIHHFAHGLPRRVKQLADLCLVAGAGADAALIDVATVENVFCEFGVAAPATPAA